MKTLCLRLLLLPIVFLVLFLAATTAIANGSGNFRATLNGYQETPSISSDGGGSFRARIDERNSLIHFVLQYTVEQPALAAHIHLGQRATAGGVSVNLCGGGGGTPLCPGASGTVTGVIDPTDIVGPNGQGLEPGDFEELVRAIRAGATYVNVHTPRFPAGEIRGQIEGNRSDRDDGGDGDD